MVHRITIILLVAGYLALAATYSFVTPLGEGPDEPGHAQYVFFLAREARLPVQCAAPCISDVLGEGHQPPLAYGLAAMTLIWLPQEQRDFDLPGNRKFLWSGGNETNAVAHGSREYWPWKDAVLAWHLARLVNVGLGAVTVVLTYFAGRRMFGPAVGIVAAVVIALNPQFLFTSGLLTNDTLLAMLSAGLLLLLVYDSRRTLGRALAIGVVLGLALITKQSALVLVPIAGLWCLLENHRTNNQHPMDQGRDAPAKRLRRVIARGIGVFGTALLISGWWYLRNWQLYGDPLGLAVFQAEFITQAFEAGKIEAWRSGLTTLHDSFWARFGWMNVPAPGWVIGYYVMLECLALAGIVRGMRNRQALISSLAYWWPLILLPLLAFAWLVSFAVTAGLVAWQGRLLFPALPAVAIVLGYGLVRLLEPRTTELPNYGTTEPPNHRTTEPPNHRTTEPQNHRTENHRTTEPQNHRTTELRNHRTTEPRNYRTTELQNYGTTELRNQEPLNRESRTKQRGGWTFWIVSWLLALGGFSLALWLPFGVIKPAYPFQTLPAVEALDRLGTPVYARFAARADERGAELRGVRIDGNPRPGETLTVTLIWHALGRQNRTWQVFLHLVDDQETILAEDNREPRNGQFRMTQWVDGDWIEDPHPLKLPADLAPGTYRLRVGLWYIKTGGRAGRYGAGDELLGDFIDVGAVTVIR